jgi:hypothetical protein
MPVDQTPPFEEATRAARAAAGRLRRSVIDRLSTPSHFDQPPPANATPADASPERLAPQTRQARLTRLNAMLLHQQDKEANRTKKRWSTGKRAVCRRMKLRNVPPVT